MVYQSQIQSQIQSQSLPLSPPDRLPLIRGALLAGALAIAGVGGGVAPPDLLLSQEQRSAYQQLMADPSQQPPGMAPLIAHVQAMSSLIAFFRFTASSGAVWLAYRLLVRSVQLEEEEAEYQQKRTLLSQANAQQLAASKQQELLLMQGELAGNAQFVEEVLAPATAEQRARAYYAAQHGLSVEEYEAILAEEQASQEALEVEAQRVAVALEKQQAQASQPQPASSNTPAIEAKAETVNPTPTPAQPEGFFNWNELKDADQHPVLGVVGPMGSGKTRVAKWLSRHVIEASLKVFDIYAADGDWGKAEVHSDFELMAVEMTKDVDLIKSLVGQYRQGKRDFSPIVCIMEEAAATTTVLRNANKKLYDVWNLYYRTVTRKIKRRIMTLSVELNAQVFGTSAESRDCATIIFPGKSGVAKALEDTDYFGLGAKQNIELRESLEQQLKGIDRPALVYVRGQWFPASIPSLSEQGDVVS